MTRFVVPLFALLMVSVSDAGAADRVIEARVFVNPGDSAINLFIALGETMCSTMTITPTNGTAYVGLNDTPGDLRFAGESLVVGSQFVLTDTINNAMYVINAEGESATLTIECQP